MARVFLDVRLAVRSVWRHRRFSAIIAITLSLGLGAATAAFSVLDSVLLRPLPFPSASQLVWVGVTTGSSTRPIGPSFPAFDLWRRRTQSLSGLALYSARTEGLSGIETPTQIRVAAVSASFFQLLGVRPLMGRAFVQADDEWGATRCVILSDSIWRVAFKADTGVIGRIIFLDRSPAAVIGVMPRDFSFPRMNVAAWVPLVPSLDFFLFGDTRIHLDGAIGRMRVGSTVRDVEQELNALNRQWSPGGRGLDPANLDRSVRVMALQRFAGSNVAVALTLVLAASGVVLLITCMNAASLLLARSATRRREIAILIAVGATPSRIAQTLLIESGILSLLGGSLGVLLAVLLTRLLAAYGAQQLPRATEIAVHPGALIFAVLSIISTVVLFGLTPALHFARTDPAGTLKGTSTSLSDGRDASRWRDVLVVVELALALILLAGAGVLAKSVFLSVTHAHRVADGRLLVASVMRPLGAWPGDKGPMRRFGEQLLTRLQSMPGVQSAAISLELPGDPQAMATLRASRTDYMGLDSVSVYAEVVSTDYFRTIGVSLLRGRLFDEKLDGAGSAPSILVSRSLARRFFPNRDAVDHYLIGEGGGANGPAQPTSFRIVGVVEDLPAQEANGQPVPEVYAYFPRDPVPHMTIIIRSDSNQAQVSASLREAVHSIDPSQPVSEARPLESVLGVSAARPKFYLVILGAFATTGVLVSVLGLFSVIVMLIRQRLRELAVRVALGASGRQIIGLVMRRGIVLVAVGLSLGAFGAWAATRTLGALLMGVSPSDPLAFASAGAALGTVALIASYLPARAAARLDPLKVLRLE